MKLSETMQPSQVLATKRKLPMSESQYTNGAKRNGTERTKADVKKSLSSEFKHLEILFSPSVEMKIWAVAERSLNMPEPPTWFPEYTKPGSTEYASKWWTESLHQNGSLMGTHDLGFMICPWARLQWDLHRDPKAFDTLMTAANTLADRFSAKVGCIRSWDVCQTKVYSFTDPSKDFLVIIDNMMNLDLLFWAASEASSQADSTRFFDIAMAHARTSKEYLIRADWSSYHVANFDPSTGTLKERLTNQGYSHTSCWSRGQAWAIAGFAKSYEWSGDNSFLDTAKNCADYFLGRLPDTHIPPWDFDAQEESGATTQPPDTSAAMVAAYGMLLIHQSLQSCSEPSPYLGHALRIVDSVCERHLNPAASQKQDLGTIPTVENGRATIVKCVETAAGLGDTILNGATINNFEFAPRRWADHGLVYADYFFVLFGNKLLEMNALRSLA
ncbi:Six-hairpin glycosidase-like protein [Fusarium oxysporum Fo47]|uniref:Six-hairpin glycosidase-like protein n=1 Tax=Fusarium oxysporum Fo47 TaxID=660027 RepID=UPI002869E0E2|nr:Six-hairpin glycosidase-like protein [Fusarium oxysporum Fo47]QKD56650.2 Six-hairpin glycosidase-like protein [Fusarium oxysporum Fo47]